ncbi:MAG: hypothetical protein LLG14_07885 [Nocardiaceae bacterium]|nr:hypothetical protein [Nocardiaceae bacterium]
MNSDAVLAITWLAVLGIAFGVGCWEVLRWRNRRRVARRRWDAEAESRQRDVVELERLALAPESDLDEAQNYVDKLPRHPEPPTDKPW